jgi:hypothetical protein
MHRRQRNLQTLRLDGWRMDKEDALSDLLLKETSPIDVSHVTCLQLFVSARWRADWYNMPYLPALRHLELHADTASVIRADGEDTASSTNHQELSQLVLEDVFGGEQDLSRLQSLALRGLDLSDAGILLQSIVMSANLSELTIQACRQATAFLQYCTTEARSSNVPLLPALRTLSIVSAQLERPFCVDAASLNGFLTQIGSLTNMLLSVPILRSNQSAVQGLNHETLVKHATTLEYAYLDIAQHDPDMFLTELAKCNRLTQLAVPFLGRDFAWPRASPAERLSNTVTVQVHSDPLPYQIS